MYEYRYKYMLRVNNNLEVTFVFVFSNTFHLLVTGKIIHILCTCVQSVDIAIILCFIDLGQLVSQLVGALWKFGITFLNIILVKMNECIQCILQCQMLQVFFIMGQVVHRNRNTERKVFFVCCLFLKNGREQFLTFCLSGNVKTIWETFPVLILCSFFGILLST